MEELIQKVIQWANDRNIIQGSNAIKQLDKTSEEFNELQRAVAVHQYIYSVDGYYGKDAAEEVNDAFGDILVTLIIAAEQLGTSLPECLSQAYGVIKDRKGRLVDGKFLKDAS